MGAGHALGFQAGGSWLHRAAAHQKILASLLLVLAMVAVPTGVWWPFAVGLAVLAAAAASAGLAAAKIARRMTIELPVVVFAAALPFFAHGPQITVAGLSVSRSGVIAAGAILAKATIGVLAGVILTWTTEPAQMIAGLHRLRMPGLLVQITSFMLRYLSVVGSDLSRMRVARESRCFSGSSLGHARVVATSAGALFVRSYERGERVHLAMLSRGYTGRLPEPDDTTARAPALPLVLGTGLVVAAAVAAWVVR